MSSSSRRTSEILYGRNPVIEAMRGQRNHVRLFVAVGAERQERIAELLAEAHHGQIAVARLHLNELNQIAGSVNHQGVALETSPYPYVKLDSIASAEQKRPILILDHLQDVQNLGTLLRTADATGTAGIIIPDRRSASITPAVVNASAGAVEHLKVARVTNLARALETCKEHGYWIVGLDGREDAKSIFASAVPEPTALLVGSEGRGIGPALISDCDLLLRIPMIGKVASLNAAVAGSVALYELTRRHLAADS